MKKYSYSQLKLFKSCPLAWKLAYLEGKKSLPSPAMERGSDKHKEIEELIKRREFTEDNRLNSLLKRLYSCEELSIETEFSVDFLNFLFVGVVDVFGVSGRKAIIVDWKTGRTEGDIEQLKGYALYVSEKYPETEIFECYFYYLDAGYYSREIFTKDEIEEFRFELEDNIYRLHEATEYPARVNWLCSFCANAHNCYALSKYQVEPITCQEEFIGLWEKVSLAEAFVKQAKDKLKTYMELNGLDMVINGAEKIYLSTTTTMRTGKLKKEELVDLILTAQGGEKKELEKKKVAELVELLKNTPNSHEIEQPNIKPLTEEKKPENEENLKSVGVIIPVENVNSATKKDDLVATIIDWCSKRGIEESEDRLKAMKKNELYDYFKSLVGYRQEQLDGLG